MVVTLYISLFSFRRSLIKAPLYQKIIVRGASYYILYNALHFFYILENDEEKHSGKSYHPCDIKS